MNDWADVIAGRIKQRQQNQQLKDTKLITVEKLKRAKGEPMWRNIRAHLAQNCADLNKNLAQNGLAVQDRGSAVRVESSIEGARGILNANFDAETGTLTWNCEGGKSGEWDIVINEDGTAAFARGTEIPMDTSKIARDMLTALLGFEQFA